MIEIQTRHIRVLLYLLSCGAQHNYVRITTHEIGQHISKSQQTASGYLCELERSGLVKRIAHGRSVSVRITPRGHASIMHLYESLRSGLESAPTPTELEGTVMSGSGEGRYYMTLDGYTRQFRKKIGYVPFPGTLNIRLDAESAARVSEIDPTRGVMMDGFADGSRTYGWVRCHAATINSRVACDLLRLERTHHDGDIVEVISGVNLRKRLRVSDDARVKISIH